MTRAELIFLDEFIEATLELTIRSKKSIIETRKELFDFIKNHRSEYATELILADRKDAAENAEVHYPASNNLNPSVNRDSIINRDLPKELTQR